MDIDTALDIYKTISSCQDTSEITKSISIRKAALHALTANPMIKIAFDTRRIDQETEFNPRRGLQNYNRSEQFISEGLNHKLKNFKKLKEALDQLKQIYGKEPEWQDSYARVLLSTLEKGLRVGIDDGDFSDAQPSVGSVDYIEELLQARYRLYADDLQNLSIDQLKQRILSKDEELTRKDINKSVEITKRDVAEHGYDTLLEKLFGGVKATSENPSVERTITITIKDKFVKEE